MQIKEPVCRVRKTAGILTSRNRLMLDEKPCEVVVTVNEEDVDGIPIGLIERGVRAALRCESVKKAEVSVTLLDDLRILEMNALYLDRERATDVIAFSLGGDAGVIGDVYIGYERARRQASELGESWEVELVRLAIHGVLHVLGYDHPDGPERTESKMFSLQERLVAQLMADESRM
ncbi:MAG TPA: rRNA maturation RNase YbeY [Gemmatimonadetes bacterium]|nr:rRNA maturation RNase YbeY [Gemmatimonadota bacterium]